MQGSTPPLPLQWFSLSKQRLLPDLQRDGRGRFMVRDLEAAAALSVLSALVLALSFLYLESHQHARSPSQ
jgi:hypothetical protein